MNLLKRTAFAVTLSLCIAGSAFAVNPADFYLELLSKGVVEFNDGRYAESVELLRVAAFGLLDAPNHYQTAQMYRALAAERLNDSGSARDAVRRVLAAERVQRTYKTLALPDSVRASFETLAKKALTASELAMLTSAPPQQQAAPPESKPPAQKPVSPPAKTTTPPQTTTPPKQVKAEPKQEPKQDPKQEPKQEPKPSKPAPSNAPAPAPRDLTQSFASGERALVAGNLAEARRVYRAMLDGPLTHEQAVKAGEGLYRARDFAGVINAFERAGALRKGEEAYHFYLAVAYYETGRIASAKKELAAALDYIEMTPDVARYREKIQNATD